MTFLSQNSAYEIRNHPSSTPTSDLNRRHPSLSTNHNLLSDGLSSTAHTCNFTDSDIKKATLLSFQPSSRSKILAPYISISDGVQVRERADHKRYHLLSTPSSISTSQNCENFVYSQKYEATSRIESAFFLNKIEGIKHDVNKAYNTRGKGSSEVFSFVGEHKNVEHLVHTRIGSQSKGYSIVKVKTRNRETSHRNGFHGRCYFGHAIVLNISSKGLLPTPHKNRDTVHSFISDQSLEWCNISPLNSPMGTTVNRVKRAREEGVFLFACDGEPQVKRLNSLNKVFGFLRVEDRDPRTKMIILEALNTRTRKLKRARNEDVFVVTNDGFTLKKKRPCFIDARIDVLGTRSFKACSKALQSIDYISNCSCNNEEAQVKMDGEGFVEFRQSTNNFVQNSTTHDNNSGGRKRKSHSLTIPLDTHAGLEDNLNKLKQASTRTLDTEVSMHLVSNLQKSGLQKACVCTKTIHSSIVKIEDSVVGKQPGWNVQVLQDVKKIAVMVHNIGCQKLNLQVSPRCGEAHDSASKFYRLEVKADTKKVWLDYIIMMERGHKRDIQEQVKRIEGSSEAQTNIKKHITQKEKDNQLNCSVEELQDTTKRTEELIKSDSSLNTKVEDIHGGGRIGVTLRAKKRQFTKKHVNEAKTPTHELHEIGNLGSDLHRTDGHHLLLKSQLTEGGSKSKVVQCLCLQETESSFESGYKKHNVMTKRCCEIETPVKNLSSNGGRKRKTQHFILTPELQTGVEGTLKKLKHSLSKIHEAGVFTKQLHELEFLADNLQHTVKFARSPKFSTEDLQDIETLAPDLINTGTPYHSLDSYLDNMITMHFVALSMACLSKKVLVVVPTQPQHYS